MTPLDKLTLQIGSLTPDKNAGSEYLQGAEHAKELILGMIDELRKNPAPINSDLLGLIGLRNNISARAMEYKAGAEYWKVMSKRAKKNTQEKVDAENQIAKHKTSYKQDKIYLEVIDKLIENEQKDN